MAIQTIGGAAASTGVQGTPILKIQRATASQAGVSFNNTEQLMEYTLSTPLPPGNYFFTFFASSSNGGAQVILGLDNGNVLAQTTSNGSTSTIATSVAAGRTLTKVWFRRNGIQNSWADNIELNAIVSTDSANFYGVRKTSANSPSFSLPPIPSGYTKLSNNGYLNAAQVSLDGTKTYFVVMRSAAYSLSATNYASNFGAEHNTNMNSALKFYEYDLITGTLTEKAQPVFNATTTCGLSWNPSSYQNANISHLYQSYCLVATDYVYFDPGVASLSATGGYSGEYPYGQMGRYTIATNTWTAVNSVRNNGLQGLQPNYAGITTAGNTLVWVPTFYLRNAYNSADSINLYLYNWYTAYANNYAYMYRPGTGWTNVYNNYSTSSYSAPRTYGSSAPATDRYVMFGTDYNTYMSYNNNTMYILDTVGAVAMQRVMSGLGSSYTSAFNGSDTALSVYSWTTTAWWRNPSDTTKVFIVPYQALEAYLVDLGSLGSSNNTANNINSYLTRTKWKVGQTSQDYYGFIYQPSLDRLIFVTNALNPNTSTTQSVKIGDEVIPFPTALASY